MSYIGWSGERRRRRRVKAGVGGARIAGGLYLILLRFIRARYFLRKHKHMPRNACNLAFNLPNALKNKLPINLLLYRGKGR